MKKLLIATTALVATAGMANADITITGHAAAGIHSGLDATAAVQIQYAAELRSNTAHEALILLSSCCTNSASRHS